MVLCTLTTVTIHLPMSVQAVHHIWQIAAINLPDCLGKKGEIAEFVDVLSTNQATLIKILSPNLSIVPD